MTPFTHPFSAFCLKMKNVSMASSIGDTTLELLKNLFFSSNVSHFLSQMVLAFVVINDNPFS